MRDDEVIVSENDLNTIGDSIVYLSDSLNQVAANVNSINGQVGNFQDQIDTMKNNVNSLETEIRDFMSEIKHSTLVGNAKQSIMLSQMEYEKKYGYRDDVRRRVIGLLQAVDINVIKKNTMENIGEEIIVNSPDYWLASALLALCYWYVDNKDMAYNALKKAMDRSDEKTSLLFCLIHLRANRVNTAIKWLNRYLSLQDPTKMDCKIILILDGLANGIFNGEMKDILLNKLNSWKQKLNAYGNYRNMQVNRWEQYFKDKDNVITNNVNYVNDFVVEKDLVNNIIHFSKFHIDIMRDFKIMMNEKSDNNSSYYDKIDKLLHTLVFDYDDEELRLRLEIQKSNNIINSNGNIKVEDNLNNNLMMNSESDFCTNISNVFLNDSFFDVDLNTKKMVVSFSKDFIIEAYQNISKINSYPDLIDLTIVIDDWKGITKDGSNELMLKKDLEKHIENKYFSDINNKALFSKNMIVSIILGLIGMIFTYKYLVVVILLFLILLIYNGFMFYNNYKHRQNKIREMNIEKENKLLILMNVIVEIVDYYFIYLDSKKSYDEFIAYISSLNYNDYIKNSLDNNKRNIIIGGK